jgi:lincosamide nucleotidyltransferase
MATVESWYGNARFASLDDTLLVDRTGRLAQHLQPLLGPAPERDSPARIQTLTANFLNAILFGANVLARGEAARALEVLGLAHRSLLWMARLVEQKTAHWPTPPALRRCTRLRSGRPIWRPGPGATR